MRLEYFCEAEGFKRLQPEWNRLVQSSHADTVFSTWEWQMTWWKHLGAGELWLGAARQDDGTLVGVFPCYRQTDTSGERALRLVGCADVADYLDIIVAKGRETLVYQAFLDALSNGSVPAWDIVDLCNIPEMSPTRTMLPDMARAAGFHVTVRQETVCPLIELPVTWEAYLMSLDKKQRHEIRRKLRRAETEAKLEWYIVDERHHLPDEMETFLHLHRLSRHDKARFMDYRMSAFFHDLAHVMLKAGWLQLMHLKLDGQIEASLLSFDYGDAIMLYNSGYNPMGHPHLSPGIVLTAICIRHAIALQKKVFDFLRGDEDYKYRFGARDTRIYRVVLSREALR